MKRPTILLLTSVLFFLVLAGGRSNTDPARVLELGSGVYNLPVMLDVNEAGQLVVTELGTGTPVPTDTPTTTNTPVPPTPTDTPEPPTPTATITTTAGIDPYPEAPPCTGHDNNTFHTIWNSTDGCHYDHEHGTSPFVADVAAAFPGLDLFGLLGDVEIGHTNPSSPAENVAKHGGFKWQVDVNAPNGCEVGFEGGTVAIDGYAVQFHEFGRQDIELEGSQHSSAALLRQCKPDNPTDKGYVYVVQLQEYGQRIAPYQGTVIPYPNNFQPEWDAGFGPYWATTCIGTGLPNCRAGLSFFTGEYNRNALSVVTSKPTGSGVRPETSLLFRLLFRSRDEYQALDTSDLVHPFTWPWLCSTDGGLTYDSTECRYNNSTATIHEIAGDIPASWDGAAFDTDTRPGRVSAVLFVTAFGALNPTCTEAGVGCYPMVLIGAFVGRYSSEVSINKVGNPTPVDTPERDIYFLNGQVVDETTLGAVPSGWIGESN